MAALTLTTFLALDGVCRRPGGRDEDTSGGLPPGGRLVSHADAGDLVATGLNALPKFVASRECSSNATSSTSPGC
jgi:hypothetical protein